MAISGSIPTLRSQVIPQPCFDTTFAYLAELSRPGSEAQARLMAVPVGESKRIELGDGIFALEQAYLTKERSEGKWESHLKYIDVQVVIAGEENLEVCEVSRLSLSENLTPAKDLLFYKPTSEGSVLRLKAGEAAILFPADGHLPGIRVDQPVLVRKSVVKVPVFQ
jgi:YhcH/YjgK/YiaL family protein